MYVCKCTYLRPSTSARRRQAHPRKDTRVSMHMYMPIHILVLQRCKKTQQQHQRSQKRIQNHKRFQLLKLTTKYSQQNLHLRWSPQLVGCEAPAAQCPNPLRTSNVCGRTGPGAGEGGRASWVEGERRGSPTLRSRERVEAGWSNRTSRFFL